MLSTIKKIATLQKFLEFDNANSDDIFELFKSVLPNSIYREAPESDEDSLYQKFLYFEGARENKVVLVAHTDTVFENDFRILNQKKKITINQKRCFVGDSQVFGIGADDRVGCAMLYLLRESGHSLLLVDGEELGCIGSKWLVEEHKDILDRLNSHQFMIQFDMKGNNQFKTYDVGSDDFDRYIEKQTGYAKLPNFF
jgi:acetylornithine deacetylase/succinyl-diaminopimelate desuccinylase-like protein